MPLVCKTRWKRVSQPDHLLWTCLLLSFSWMIPLCSGQGPCMFVAACKCYKAGDDPDGSLTQELLPRVTCFNLNDTQGQVPHLFDSQLRSLTVSNSLVERIIDVGYYVRVEVVDLSSNRITAVKEGDFVKNGILRSLDLSNNRISTLQPGCFTPLTQLRVLILKENSLADFDTLHFMALPALEMLNLSHNQLTGVDLLLPASANGSFPANLTTLSLHHNPHLDAASVSRTPSGSMNESDNESPPDSSPLPITFLDLSFTASANLSLVLRAFPALLSLNLSGCGVQQFSLRELETAADLRELVLRGNGIREIGGFPGGRRGLAVDVGGNDVRCECWMLHSDASPVVWTGLDCISNPRMAATLTVMCEEKLLPSGVFLPLLIIILLLLLSSGLLTGFCCYRHNPDACRRWLRCSCFRTVTWRRRHTGRKQQPELMAFVAASSSVSSTPTMQSVSPTPELGLHEPAQFIRANARTLVHAATDGLRISKAEESDEDSLYEAIGEARGRSESYVNQQYIDAQNQPVTQL